MMKDKLLDAKGKWREDKSKKKRKISEIKDKLNRERIVKKNEKITIRRFNIKKKHKKKI